MSPSGEAAGSARKGSRRVGGRPGGEVPDADALGRRTRCTVGRKHRSWGVWGDAELRSCGAAGVIWAEIGLGERWGDRQCGGLFTEVGSEEAILELCTWPVLGQFLYAHELVGMHVCTERTGFTRVESHEVESLSVWPLISVPIPVGGYYLLQYLVGVLRKIVR